MAGITGSLTAQVLALLTSTSSGINARITSIQANDATLTAPGVRSVVAQNVSVDLAESAGQAQYPALLVYCEKVQNPHRLLLSRPFFLHDSQSHPARFANWKWNATISFFFLSRSARIRT